MEPDEPTPTPGSPQPRPPRAQRRPHVLEVHGDRRVDDWYWLRDRDDPAVLDHLRAENAYTQTTLAHLAPEREALYEEIRARIVESDLSVPVRRGPWWYYQRTVEGSSYAIHCRIAATGTPGSQPPPAGPADGRPWPGEQVVIDENALAEGHAYLALGALSVSPGHGLVAYSTDTSGDERFELRVRNLAVASDLTDVIAGTSYGVAWADDDTLFYTRPDAANRPFQVWRHALGSDPADDVLVHQEDDERFFAGVGRTKDGAYVVIDLSSMVTSESYLVPTGDPTAAPRLVAARRQGVEYSVEHHHGTFVVVTNDGALDFRLVVAPSDHPDAWRELLAERPGTRLLGIDVFERALVCYERRQGQLCIALHDLPAADAWSAPLGEGRLVEGGESPATFSPGANPEFGATSLRYAYSSLVTPASVYDLDLDRGPGARPQLRKRQPVLGGYDPAHYATTRLWTRAEDGTEVPMSLVHHRDVVPDTGHPDGTAPGLLYGYGAYEHSIDPTFSSIRLSLLERGFVFAIAHVRGGGEMGRRWYEDGKLLAKPHTFTDFVACARALLDGGWVAPGRLVARGGSAGGLLMGAVANAAPELFAAVVAEVPFVDCLTTMLDPSLPLTVTEWEEWGNPGADPEIYRVMRSYSPYDNVHAGPYPSILATGGLEDPRVGYWEPAKWVQKLREATSPTGPVLLKMELEAGHAGPSGRYEAWRDEAFVLSFVLDAVGGPERRFRPAPGVGTGGAAKAGPAAKAGHKA